MGCSLLCLATGIALTLVVAWAYRRCMLNSVLPQRWQKTGCVQSSGFVGAYGRSPGMQNCLAWSDKNRHMPYFNRCMYV